MKRIRCVLAGCVIYCITSIIISVLSVPNGSNDTINFLDLKNIKSSHFKIVQSKDDPDVYKITHSDEKPIDLVSISNSVLWSKIDGIRCSGVTFYKVPGDQVLISLNLSQNKLNENVFFTRNQTTTADHGILSSFFTLNKSILEDKVMDETFDIFSEFDKFYYRTLKKEGETASYSVYEPRGKGRITKVYDSVFKIYELTPEEKSCKKIEIYTKNKARDLISILFENGKHKYFRSSRLSREEINKELFDKLVKLLQTQLDNSVDNVKPSDGVEINMDLLDTSKYDKSLENVSNIKVIKVQAKNYETLNHVKKIVVLGSDIVYKSDTQVTEITLSKLPSGMILLEATGRVEGVRKFSILMKKLTSNSKFMSIDQAEFLTHITAALEGKNNKLRQIMAFEKVEGKIVDFIPVEILDKIAIPTTTTQSTQTTPTQSQSTQPNVTPQPTQTPTETEQSEALANDQSKVDQNTSHESVHGSETGDSSDEMTSESYVSSEGGEEEKDVNSVKSLSISRLRKLPKREEKSSFLTNATLILPVMFISML